MGLSFSEDIVDAGVVDFEQSECDAALEAVQSVLECYVARTMPVVPDPVLSDLMQGGVGKELSYSKKRSKLLCPFCGRLDLFHKTKHRVHVFGHSEFRGLKF